MAPTPADFSQAAVDKGTANKVYAIACTAMNTEGLVADVVELYVVAPTSAAATRRAVAFFKELFPSSNVKSIEVVAFNAMPTRLVITGE